MNLIKILSILLFICFIFACEKESEIDSNQIKRATQRKTESKQLQGNTDKNELNKNTEVFDEKQISILILEMGSPDRLSSFDACKKIVKIGKPAVSYLLKALNNKENVFQQIRAAQALGAIRDKRAIQPLINSLNSSDFDFLLSVIQSLYDMTHAKIFLEELKTAVPVLLPFLEHENVFLREAVANTLGYYRDERVVKPLEKALKEDKNKYVREAALKSLKVYKKIIIKEQKEKDKIEPKNEDDE